MSSIIQQKAQQTSQMQRRTSPKSNEFPMPVLKAKKSKFASDAESDSVRTQPQPSRSKRAKAKLVGNDLLSQQAYWGRVKPYCFDARTNTPRFIIAPTFLRSLFLNVFIIAVICVALPVLTNRNMFGQSLTPSGHNRLLEPQAQQRTLVDVSARYVARKYSIYIFSGAWTCYQLLFLLILLLGNPGYGDPLAQKQICLEEQKEILELGEGRRTEGYSRCTTCKAIVDNSVFHCPECDLCCEGFSHHCEWIGKCVGYRSEVFLQAYYYGFFAGVGLLVLLIILQSLPYH